MIGQSSSLGGETETDCWEKVGSVMRSHVVPGTDACAGAPLNFAGRPRPRGDVQINGWVSLGCRS